MNLKRTLVTLAIAASISAGWAAPTLAAPSPTPAAKQGQPAKALPSKHRAWSEAVTILERAKKVLQSDKSQDVNNHRSKAVEHIQKAMQELRAGTQGEKH